MNTLNMPVRMPDMAASTALELGKNHRVQAAWNGAIQFEKALENSLVDQSKRKDKRAFRDFLGGVREYSDEVEQT